MFSDARGLLSPRCAAKNAPVAQLDRALDYESRGQEFESLRARHFTTGHATTPFPRRRPASRMIPASCGSPGREPRNPARDVGPEILVLRSERTNEHRLLVPHDKRVEGEPHQHTVRKKALVAEQGRLA